MKIEKKAIKIFTNKNFNAQLILPIFAVLLCTVSKTSLDVHKKLKIGAAQQRARRRRQCTLQREQQRQKRENQVKRLQLVILLVS